ncbi:MAG: hypothetical protein MJ188_05070 [Treponema sp.]|nr:hypothetical protein [Treponema sp.]
MLAFLLLLLPFTLAIYCVWAKEPREIMSIFIGTLSAILLCAFKVLFTYSHRIVPYSFKENFLYFLFRQNCVPVIVVFLLFFLIVKDTAEVKINSFFPLLCSFYIVFLPYTVISGAFNVYTAYFLFIAPISCLAMLVQCAVSLHYIYENLLNKRYVLLALNIVLMIVYLILPAVFNALYYINYSIPLLLLYNILFAVFPLGFVLFMFILSMLRKEK